MTLAPEDDDDGGKFSETDVEAGAGSVRQRSVAFGSPPLAEEKTGELSQRDSAASRASEDAEAKARKKLQKRQTFLEARLARETDSCYLLAAAVGGESRLCNPLSPVLLVAVGIQVLIPIQAFVYLCKEETFLAPGFRSKEDTFRSASLRRRWFNHFFLDFTAFILLLYLYMASMSSQDHRRQLKFFWRCDGGLTKALLALGSIASLVAHVFSMLIPYMLFRTDPSTTDMLLNALALEFMIHAHEILVRNLEANASFHRPIVRARARLAALGREVQKHDPTVMESLVACEMAPLREVLRRSARDKHYRGELLTRLGDGVYRVVAFCALVLSITGGHVAHVHFRAVLYFFGMWPHVPRGSGQWLVLNKNASNPDAKYWLAALLDIAIVALFVFAAFEFAKWYRKRKEAARAEADWLASARSATASAADGARVFVRSASSAARVFGRGAARSTSSASASTRDVWRWAQTNARSLSRSLSVRAQSWMQSEDPEDRATMVADDVDLPRAPPPLPPRP